MKMRASSIHQTLAAAALALLATGCATDDLAQAGGETQGAQERPSDAITFTGGTAENRATAPALTRTSITHTLGQGAEARWSTGDRIWVKDDGGTFRQSTAGVLNGTKTRGVFSLASGSFSNGCQVNYVGNSSSGTQVTIATAQTQTAPNDFAHAGEAGDCGTATATGNGTDFNFRLEHRASYLCLLPRSANPYVNRSKIFKIEITSENSDIAGTYDFVAGTLVPKSGGSRTITLTTGSGFSIDNAATDVTKNGAYVVIAPGYHELAIRYWLRNPTDNPNGTVEGTITKYVNLTCSAGKITEVTANLIPMLEYSNWDHYMWNAALPYWQGGSPSYIYSPYTQPGVVGSNYPTSASDSRWYEKGNSSSAMPNVNEMLWYARDGDWHSDRSELFVWKGHLWPGGAWVLRRKHISGMNASVAPDGKDYRSTALSTKSFSISHGTRPAKSQLGKYFFIPYIGYYRYGVYKKNVPEYGFRHTSTKNPNINTHSYYMDFYFNGLFVSTTVKTDAAVEQPFE